MPDGIIQHTAIVTAPAIPVEIAKAISDVMSQIKSLPKDERNEHGHYNFASIDAFLSAIGPLCVSAGLIIVQDEESVEILDRGGKGWVRITYSFVLAHSSGVVWDRPLRRTVLQQIAGPQTTGSAQSYALKMFMRSLFQIPTGEEDADSQPKEAMGARQDSQDRVQRPALTHPQKQLEAPQRPPEGPAHIAIPTGNDGLMVGTWTRLALDALASMPSAATRLEWIELHSLEMAEVRRLQPAYAAKIEETAGAKDQTHAA